MLLRSNDVFNFRSQGKGSRSKSTSSTTSNGKKAQSKNEVVSVVKRKMSQVGMKVTVTKKDKNNKKSTTTLQTNNTTTNNKQRPKSSEDRTSYLKNKQLAKTSPAVPVAREVKKAWSDDVTMSIYDDSNLRPQSGDSNDSGIAIT